LRWVAWPYNVGNQEAILPTDESGTPIEGESSARRFLLPQWAVVLHNVDYANAHYVVTCLVNTVDRLTPERASEIVQDTQAHGVARVITCPLEIAELYRERLESLVLPISLERA
jgi:ATP-dependent Clp protease adapter protein ClpS